MGVIWCDTGGAGLASSAVEESEEVRLRLEAKELSLRESRKMAAAKEQSMLEDKAAAEEQRERQAAAIAELKGRVDKVRGVRGGG